MSDALPVSQLCELAAAHGQDIPKNLIVAIIMTEFCFRAGLSPVAPLPLSPCG